MFKIALAETSNNLKEAATILEQIRAENPKHWPNGLTVGHFDGGLYLVREKQASLPVGFVGWQERQEGLTKVGYYSIGILPAHRQNGFARDAVATLLTKKAKQVDRVQAMIVEGNTPSVRLADGLGVGRKMVKLSSTQERKVDRFGMGIAGTMGAAHLAARPVHNLLNVRNTNHFRDAALDFTTLGDLKREADFPYLYAEHGHRLSASKARINGADTTLGDAFNNAKPHVADFLDHMPEWAKDRQIGSDGNFKVRNFIDYLRDPEAGQAALEHYQRFAKSPFDAYRQMLDEMPAAKDSLDEFVNINSHALANLKTPQARNDFMYGIQRLKMSHKADFTPWFDYLGKLIGHQPEHTQDQVRQLLYQHPGIGQQLKPHRDLLGAFDVWASQNGVKNLDQLRNQEHLLTRYLNPMMTGHFMKRAPKAYGRVAKLIDVAQFLASRKFLAGAGILGLASTYPVWQRKQASTEQHYNNAHHPGVNVGLPALIGAVGLGHAADKADYYGVRRLNPLGSINAVVLGGVRNFDPTQVGKVPMDSFSAQSHALTKALQDNGIPRTAHLPIYDRTKDFAPRDLRDILRNYRDYDFIAQVGSTPIDAELGQLHGRGLRRYRALSDFAEGNFQQPDMEFGKRNWMRVHDPEAGYDRFLVPGLNRSGIQGNLGAAHAPLNLDSIPVSDVFKNTHFSTKLPGKVKAVVSMGGGSAAHSLFTDVVDPVKSKDMASVHDVTKANVLDDIATALRANHGDNFDLEVLMANAADKPSGTSELLTALKQQAEAGDPRWKNVRFTGLMPQGELAKRYSEANHIFMLPGSSVAELLAMPGNSVPRVTSLIPDKSKWWLPQHFQTNADMFGKMFYGAGSVGVTDTNRLEKLTKVVRQGLPVVLDPRKPVTADYADAARQMLKDVRLSRLKNLGHVAGVGLPAAGLLGLAAYNTRDLSRERTRIEKIKDWLYEKTR